jgi:hypothetical protein
MRKFFRKAQVAERYGRMSALPPKADIRCRDRHVRFVPKAEVAVIRSVERSDVQLQHDCCSAAKINEEKPTFNFAMRIDVDQSYNPAKTITLNSAYVQRLDFCTEFPEGVRHPCR